MIRPAKLSDANAICDIYDYYVTNTTITFEEEPVSIEEMQKRIADTSKKYPWLVYEADGSIVGYAYAMEWKARRSYRYSVESTVYLKNDSTAKGIGSALYEALLDELNKMDIHVVIGGVALPNDASVALHACLPVGRKNLGSKRLPIFGR